MKLSLKGRIPLDVSPSLRFALDGIFSDITRSLNEVIDTVMASAVHSSAITADTLVKTGQAKYRGYTITVVTAGGAIDIRDATSAGTGTIVDTIPAGTAAGTKVEKMIGGNCETGIYVDYAGGATGTLVVWYE